MCKKEKSLKDSAWKGIKYELIAFSKTQTGTTGQPAASPLDRPISIHYRKSILMILKHLETDASLLRIKWSNDTFHKIPYFKIKTFAAVNLVKKKLTFH